MNETSSIMKELFDISFKNFITVRVIKTLYLIAIIIIGMLSLFLLISAFGTFKYSPVVGLIQILLAPLIFLAGVTYSRVFLETILVLFRIESNTASRENA